MLMTLRDTKNNENVIASPFAFVIARRSRSNLIRKFLAEFTLSRKNEILRSAQNDMRRARNDKLVGIFI
ncbi:MAG: hypothetical protein A2889_01570 [Nitrospinae bacterium RIFCSPLOWO2_01_FULL_39_10]|nr:MAG: hypothetical protein A2889_01570 [Nitrospinae bacterium RIFCSPLOWO2_01_FULL_39_10]